MIKVKDAAGLYRDEKSGAIVSSCDKDYVEHLKKRTKLQKKAQEELALKDDINNLKNELREIKDLVLALVQNKNGK